MKDPLLNNEAARLETLYQYEILDTKAEESFDELTRLAALVCETPIALVSLVDARRQWFKSKVGMEATETLRALAFCAQTIQQPDVLIVPDALADQRFATNPLVTSAPHIRFYAGVSLITPDGHALGTLCVIDRVPRELSPLQVEALRTLGHQVMTQLELQRHVVALARTATESKQTAEALRQQTEREQLVVDIAQRIRQSLKLEEILSTTVSEVRQFLQVERVFIYRFLADWSGIVVVESVSADRKPILGSRLKDPTFAESYVQLYKQGRIQATADIYAGELTQCYVDFLAEFQVRATLVVPILQGDELWGLLVANHCSSPRQWQQLESDLLKSLAAQVGLAIQQSTLFEQVQTELAERLQAEQKISEQAALLNVATDAIFVRDLANQISFWNQGAEHLYGWQAKEVLGKKANELLYKEALPKLEDAQKTVALQGEWSGELHQVTKSGQEVIVSSRWTLVRDEAGQPKSILVVNTDITEKKQLEAQFLRAQRLESIGTLASGIAHDLNNVLGPVLMVAELLEEKIPDARSQQLLAELQNSAKRGAALVKQVLSFARGLEGQRAPVQVRHLLLEIQHIAKRTFPKSIEIYTDISPTLWTVYADATQLHQVLMNLVVNARDAMPDGGTLSICAENLLIDENYARMNLDASVGPYSVITISDMGTGMSPEILERIFEPFFTTKEVGKGTGLGLSTVIGIIKSHGGFVKVDSKVGQGSQFQVYLPAVSDSQTQLSEDLELLSGQGELILVVDDEAPIREITKITLETYNYKVLIANDGIEALAVYAQHKHEINTVLSCYASKFLKQPKLGAGFSV